MEQFRNPVDVVNRALQHCGVQRITTLQDDSLAAAECAFAYDKSRRAELRRNVWQFATRKACLRPVQAGTMYLKPAVWSSATTYGFGSIVTDVAGVLWQSRLQANKGNAPGNTPDTTTAWELYCGPLAVQPWDSTGATAYFAGELVYVTPGDGTYVAYLSLQNGNTDNPATPTAYSATVQYSKDNVVQSGGISYVSLVDFNLGHTPAGSPTLWSTSNPFGTGSDQWLPVAVTLTDLTLIYPIGAGPSFQTFTKNAYRLPANYLRKAPQDPKRGSVSFLGAPTGYRVDDWLFEGQFLVTQENLPIVLRFVADVTDVATFDDMFCEGLAARIALAVTPRLTQSVAKINEIAAMYKVFMTEARTVNAVEVGAEEMPEDDYITSRI